jgi:streptogramin lyase
MSGSSTSVERHRNGHALIAALAMLLVAALTGSVSDARAQSTTATITEFYVGGTPYDVAAGPDGNLWFTDYVGNQIGRMTPEGSVTRYAIPSFFSGPSSISAGADGNVWFTELNTNKIGRITPSGVITEFGVPTPVAGLYGGLTAGADGNVWFAEGNANKLGRITPTGQVTEFPIGFVHDVASGPDGNLWTISAWSSGIARVTPSGQPTYFFNPASGSPGGAITGGPDGAVWFTYSGSGGWIGKMTTAGVFVGAFPIPTPGNTSLAITAGPDGNVWFAEWNPGKIARITPTGAITEYPVSNGGLSGITAGPDGNIWFSSRWGGFIGRLDVPDDTTPPVITVPGNMDLPATSLAGRNVSFEVSAADDTDGSVPVSCTPASGSVFAIGDTLVECTAVDAAGNDAHASFTVHVQGAAEQLVHLLEAVAGVGPGTSLAEKVRDARDALARGDVDDACSALRSMLNQVAAQAGKGIPAGVADSLIADATRIRSVLSC